MKNSIIFFLLFTNLNVFSQITEKGSLTGGQKSKEVVKLITVQDLQGNGINSSKINEVLPTFELEKLLNYDFSSYRKYNQPQKIQIENGPIIELLSIQEMISNGTTFNSEYVLSKKDIDYSTISHEIIPIVNVGFGKISSEEIH
jgi:hypothetical protein